MTRMSAPLTLPDLSATPLVRSVRIEEPAGRAEYARRQREFAARGQSLRVRLLAVLDAAAGAAPGTGPDAEWPSSARP